MYKTYLYFIRYCRFHTNAKRTKYIKHKYRNKLHFIITISIYICIRFETNAYCIVHISALNTTTTIEEEKKLEKILM